jgi:hypothetical protein
VAPARKDIVIKSPDAVISETPGPVKPKPVRPFVNTNPVGPTTEMLLPSGISVI